MKFRKRNRNIEIHRRRYIALSVTLFIIAFIFVTWQFAVGWNSVVGDIAVSPITGVFALFISAAMTFMGVFYLMKK